ALGLRALALVTGGAAEAIRWMVGAQQLAAIRVRLRPDLIVVEDRFDRIELLAPLAGGTDLGIFLQSLERRGHLAALLRNGAQHLIAASALDATLALRFELDRAGAALIDRLHVVGELLPALLAQAGGLQLPIAEDFHGRSLGPAVVGQKV